MERLIISKPCLSPCPLAPVQIRRRARGDLFSVWTETKSTPSNLDSSQKRGLLGELGEAYFFPVAPRLFISPLIVLPDGRDYVPRDGDAPKMQHPSAVA